MKTRIIDSNYFRFNPTDQNCPKIWIPSSEFLRDKRGISVSKCVIVMCSMNTWLLHTACSSTYPLVPNLHETENTIKNNIVHCLLTNNDDHASSIKFTHDDWWFRTEPRFLHYLDLVMFVCIKNLTFKQFTKYFGYYCKLLNVFTFSTRG